MKRILIVEDDAMIASLERDYLELHGFSVDLESDGEAALASALREDYDLLLLDLMLPGKNGYEICQEVRRQKEIPILMVTARNDSMDKIRGLGIGADDYIEKPFDPLELVARVQAHIKRYERLTGKGKEEKELLCFGDVCINVRSHQIWKGKKELRLPKKEYDLLVFLASHPGTVFSKEELVETIWGYDAIGELATVTVHINRIREKIEDGNNSQGYIETVWGTGYRFRAPAENT